MNLEPKWQRHDGMTSWDPLWKELYVRPFPLYTTALSSAIYVRLGRLCTTALLSAHVFLTGKPWYLTIACPAGTEGGQIQRQRRGGTQGSGSGAVTGNRSQTCDRPRREVEECDDARSSLHPVLHFANPLAQSVRVP